MSARASKPSKGTPAARARPVSVDPRPAPSPGLVIVYTGKGKGKTTAALGLALRAAGHRMKTLVVQFVKGAWKSGEVEAARLLAPYLEVRPMGKGFVRPTGGKPAGSDIVAARKALESARQASQTGEYDILVLDEVNVAIDLGLLKPGSVLALLDKKPPGLTLVLTGEPAHPAILQKADLVTRMEEVKHPFRKHIKAKMGIDY